MTRVRARRAISGGRQQRRASLPVTHPVRYHRRALLLARWCVGKHGTMPQEGTFMERLSWRSRYAAPRRRLVTPQKVAKSTVMDHRFQIDRNGPPEDPMLEACPTLGDHAAHAPLP